MFIAIVLIILGFIGLLSFRDWICNHRLSTRDVQYLLTRISKLIILEEWREAKKLLNPLVQNSLGGKESELLQIQVLRGTKEHAKALQKAVDGTLNYPEELLFRVEEGKTYLEMEQAELALHAFQIALPILRKESDLLDFAVSYLKAGFADKCWEILEPLLTANPNGKPSAACLQLAGDASLELKEYARAVNFYNNAINRGWNNRQLQTQLGTAQRHLGNYNESERIYRKILEKDSGDILATLGLGACMQERGFYQKALLIYQSGVAWSKKDPQIVLQAALCAFYAGRYGYAEKYFCEVIKTQGPTSELLSYYGYALEQQNKWAAAEQNYLEQIHIFANDPSGYRSLAWLYGVGLTTSITSDNGLICAHRAIELMPDPISWEILSACEARIGHFEAAHEIQEYLAGFDVDKEARVRRQHVLKLLRKQLPLDTQHLSRKMVA